MEEISQFVINGMYFLIDMAIIIMVMASVAILVYAVATMVKNRQPRWDNLLFIPAALFLFAVSLQVLPPLFMKSTRIGLADSRAEADLLRTELKGWLPENPPPDEANPTPEQVNLPLPSAAATDPAATVTPWIVTVVPLPATPVISEITATPVPTATPIPPTSTAVICYGRQQNWLPNCILPTPAR